MWREEIESVINRCNNILFLHIMLLAIEFAYFGCVLLTSKSSYCIIKMQIGNYLKCLLLLDEQLKQDRVQMFVATRYATNQEVEFKCLRLHSKKEWSFLLVR